MKTVLITGANQGLGLETARQLVERGCFVYLGTRSPDKGYEAVRQLHATGLEHCEALELDVTDRNSIERAERILAQKTGKLDVLINNAGIRGEIPQNASTVSLDELKRVFDTNFFGVVQVTQAFLPLLRNAEVPVIVNVTSDLGSLALRSDPNRSNYRLERAAYAPSKTVLNAYTVALATELKEAGFKVNCVNPGHTATAFNQFKGVKPVSWGAAPIVKYALLDAEGPTGKFFSEEGETPW